MRSKLVALVLIAFCAGMSEAQDSTANLENSVVKVFSSMRYRDPYKPGAKQAPADATGSGVVISGNRILTNAHVVMFAGEVQVRANQSGGGGDRGYPSDKGVRSQGSPDTLAVWNLKSTR